VGLKRHPYHNTIVYTEREGNQKLECGWCAHCIGTNRVILDHGNLSDAMLPSEGVTIYLETEPHNES
jgi:hypothetical protein